MCDMYLLVMLHETACFRKYEMYLSLSMFVITLLLLIEQNMQLFCHIQIHEYFLSYHVGESFHAVLNT